MSVLIKRFSRNTHGRDFVVGDIHGHFTRLEEALATIAFDYKKDRLFSVGDLVDRGPECNQVIEWISRPWFHAVQGNHEDMAVRWPRGFMDLQTYELNGGGWNVANTREKQIEISRALEALPIAIELETADGLVGIVHADCPQRTWESFSNALRSGWVKNDSGEMRNSKNALNSVIDQAMWGRTRIENNIQDGVPDIKAVVVGHTSTKSPLLLGNVFHIDTAGWHPEGTGFTFLDAATLNTTTVPKPSLAQVKLHDSQCCNVNNI